MINSNLKPKPSLSNLFHLIAQSINFTVTASSCMHKKYKSALEGIDFIIQLSGRIHMRHDQIGRFFASAKYFNLHFQVLLVSGIFHWSCNWSFQFAWCHMFLRRASVSKWLLRSVIIESRVCHNWLIVIEHHLPPYLPSPLSQDILLYDATHNNQPDNDNEEDQDQ